jgi:hypothetical protein
MSGARSAGNPGGRFPGLTWRRHRLDDSIGESLCPKLPENICGFALFFLEPAVELISYSVGRHQFASGLGVCQFAQYGLHLLHIGEPRTERRPANRTEEFQRVS